MKKFYKIMFINSMITGTMIAASAYSWMSMWMGLEINLLSVIPLMTSTKNMLSSEASAKYFLTQALASLILMFGIISLLMTNETLMLWIKTSLSMMMSSALMTKIGTAPFHFWFPEVIEGLSWNTSFILLTWQKIAPMILLMSMNPNALMMSTVIILSTLIGGTLGLNQTSLRKILAFSSITHIGWMMAASQVSTSVWTWYFIIYSMLTLNIIAIFKWSNSFFIKQIINSINSLKIIKFSFMMNFLSLGGLPPFLGFLPKWLVINSLINMKQVFLPLLMSIITLISLYMYIRIIFSSLTLYTSETKTPQFFEKNYLITTINILSSFMIVISTFLFNLI